MSIRALLGSFFQGVSQTLVVSLVLLALFNSTIGAPALESSSSGAVSSTSPEAAPATPASSHPPDTPPASSRDGSALLPERKATAAASAAVLPAKIDIGSPQKSADLMPTSLQAATQKLGAQGPVFIENKGQFDSRVKFLVKGNGANLWLTNEGIVFDFQRPAEKQSSADAAEKGGATKSPSPDEARFEPRVKSDLPAVERLVLTQKLVGAAANPTIEARDPHPEIYNYFFGSDPNKWRTHVLGYKEVLYRNIWKGVDLKLFANGPNLEEEFVVHPGANASAVQLAYEGVEGLAVGDDGSLKVATSFGAIVETSPRIYQESLGKETQITGKFKIVGNSYSFEVARRDEQSDLIIDPTIIYSKPARGRTSAQGTLLYSTFLGGSAGEACHTGCGPAELASGIAVDASGSAYVTGFTGSTDFPITNGAFQQNNPNSAFFITKFSPLGDRLEYSTYLGGFALSAVGIAVNSAGEAYITGVDYHNSIPTTASALQKNVDGAFLTVLSAKGDSLIYSTGFGVGGVGFAVAIDSVGRAYLTGATEPNCEGGTIPTTANAFQSTYPGGCAAFLGVLDPSQSGLSSLVYGSYLGGSANNSGRGIAVDAYNMAYVGGNTVSSDFPVTPGAFQTTYAGSGDAFLTKFNPYASTGPASVLYSTYIGGGGTEYAAAVGVDSNGNAFIIGSTTSGFRATSPFPTTAGALQPTCLAPWCGQTGFVTKFNAAGNGLIFSTYWGGVGGPNALATDIFGNSYAAGSSAGALMVSPDAYQPYYNGAQDGFVSKFDAQGGLSYSSYLGGFDFDVASAVAADSIGDAYVTGYTLSADFPVTQGAFQMTLNPGGSPPEDAYFTKFPLGDSGVLSITGILPHAGGNAGSVTAQIIGTGFHAGATATLACGSINIQGNNPTVSGGGQIITATFDLTTTAPGVCDVVVTNADMNSITLSQGFTVQQGGAANIQIDKTGTLAITNPTGPTNITYAITVSNTGNVDAIGGAVSEALDSEFSLTSVNPPAATAVATAAAEHYVLWIGPTIGPGVALQFIYAVTVDPATPVGSPLVGGPACYLFPVAFYSFLSCMVTELIQGNNPACLGAVGFCGLAATTCNPYVLTYNPFLCKIGVTGCFNNCISCWPTIQSCGQQALSTCGFWTQTLQGRAYDPNYLAGSNGIGGNRWVNGVSGLSYVVSFGNEPNATAAAQQVVITQPLDQNIDVSALRLNFITVPNLNNPLILISIPPGSFNPAIGRNNFTTNIDLRPEQSLFVTADAKLNANTNTITWTFNSIDPTTGLPPTNPLVGMLPPGANASVSFVAKAKQSLPTGTQLSEQGSVVFNANSAINTNTWINTIDNTPPTSHVLGLPGTETCSDFKVQWSGSDVGAGTKSYTIYASDNGGAFAPWLTNTNSTSSVYQGQVGHTYGFYSIARDLVGNVEPAKTTAEATTKVTSASSCGPPSLSGAASVVSYVNNTLSLNLQLTDIGTSDALNTLVKTLSFRTLGGTGTVTLVSPTLPFIFGTVSVDSSITIPVTLNVPSTVTKFSMTEGGTMQDAAHKTYNFSIGQNVVP